jgi:hypothetical protein
MIADTHDLGCRVDLKRKLCSPIIVPAAQPMFPFEREVFIQFAAH